MAANFSNTQSLTGAALAALFYLGESFIRALKMTSPHFSPGGGYSGKSSTMTGVMKLFNSVTGKLANSRNVH
jgi:hypothetical protein